MCHDYSHSRSAARDVVLQQRLMRGHHEDHASALNGAADSELDGGLQCHNQIQEAKHSPANVVLWTTFLDDQEWSTR